MNVAHISHITGEIEQFEINGKETDSDELSVYI